MSNVRALDVIEDLLSGKEIFFRYIKTVGDLMSQPAIKVTLDQSLKEILDLFEIHNIRHLPVIDVDEKTKEEFLVGVISNRDILRQLSPGYGTLAEKGTDQISLRLLCSTVFTRNIETIAPQDLLFPAIEKMLRLKVDCLPVVDETKLACGMITSTDIIKAFVRIAKLSRFVKSKDESNHRLIDLRTTRMRMAVFDPNVIFESYFQSVGDIMNEELYTLLPGAPLEDAMRLIQKHKIRHIPVVDNKGNFLGMISDRDVLSALPPNRMINSVHGKGDADFRARLFSIENNGTLSSRTEVRYIMTGKNKLHTVNRVDSLTDAADLMLDNKINCLPVVVGDSQSMKIEGIMTSTDIMRAVSMLINLVNKER
jgi:acetoin utilization protein AcuB